MSRVLGLAHVGIAVRSLESAVPLWVHAFGFDHVETTEFDSMKLRIAFLQSGSSELELLEPTQADSPVGLELIDRTPREGSRHTKIAFLSPRTLNGVLVELCEVPR
jgi:catechol 2,3-dioxygenase-like lactoylglutathione lyase family enzyme